MRPSGVIRYSTATEDRLTIRRATRPLRSRRRRLFDLGYVTVSQDGRFEVSRRLKADFDNGRHYYALHGKHLRPPRGKLPGPAPDALAWHREHRYLG